MWRVSVMPLNVNQWDGDKDDVHTVMSVHPQRLGGRRHRNGG